MNARNNEKMINDIYMGIVFILVRKNVGVTVEILKMCQMKGSLIQNVPKIRVNCFIPLFKVNIINFDYDHNIIHLF